MIGDLVLSVVFAAGTVLFARLGLRGLRGGTLWIDRGAGFADLEPEALRGSAARFLGWVYLAAAAGCVAALASVWR